MKAGPAHESLHRSGRWLDIVGYAILKEKLSPTRADRRALLPPARDDHAAIAARLTAGAPICALDDAALAPVDVETPGARSERPARRFRPEIDDMLALAESPAPAPERSRVVRDSHESADLGILGSTT